MDPIPGTRLTREALLEAADTAFLLFPTLPGWSEELDIQGLRGRVTASRYPTPNGVVVTRLMRENAGATIKQVLDLFASQDKGFIWTVSPLSTPPNLADRLTAAGLRKEVELACMVLTDLRTPMPNNSEIAVREATREDIVASTAMRARAYGMTEELAREQTNQTLAAWDRVGAHYYLAYAGEEPVGFANMIVYPDKPVVWLGGAATLSEYRGKGVYTALTARRLADASDLGARAALIHANRQTSAPIVANLGFTELCGIDIYIWTPGEVTI